MGCGPSKEATSTGPASRSAAVPPKAEAAVARTATPATAPAGAGGGSKAATTGGGGGGVTRPSRPSSKEEQQKTLDMLTVQLNDVVPGSKGRDGSGRGRFLSYASGASTPNSSSGELSLSSDGSSNGGTSGDRSPKQHKPKKGGGGNGGGAGLNSKMLKRSHSGSAIDLENLHDKASLTSKVVHIEVPFGKPIEEVYDGIHTGPILGSGVSGLVRRVSHKATGVEYAVKCLDLGLVGTKEGLLQLREEIFIMCQLDHPNIVRLEEVYESHSEIYLVQELCRGGELFDRLDEQPEYHYTEAECARLVKQMLSAVRYLHSKGIIHRDLKLENYLFSSKAADSELKMIDFGLSKHFSFGEVHHEAVGTPYTVAPEVIRGTYDERCDIWAIGVITFLLFSGDPPFGGCGGPEPLMKVRENILNGDFAFKPPEIWDVVSNLGKEFVREMLVTDPKARPTARVAQKHPWLKQWASRDAAGMSIKDANVLSPNVVRALVNFKEFSDMRKLLSEVLSFTLLPDQIQDLRKEFEKMDTDGSGEISLKQLKKVLVSNAGAGSLGALTEEEVEDIFNAMRVNKAETRIHWHEFIAAGLTQCRVDDRNLRLAFDRLDGDHKGYITLDDIVNLMGNDDLHNEEDMRVMWTDSLRSVNCTQRHITYDHFLLLMKGQTKEPPPSDMIMNGSHHEQLQIVHEEEAESSVNESIRTATTSDTALDTSALLAEGSQVAVDLPHDANISHFISQRDDDEPAMSSLPNLGVHGLYGSGSLDAPVASPGSAASPGRKTVTIVDLEDTGKAPYLSTDNASTQDSIGASPTGGKKIVGMLPYPDLIRRQRSKSLENEALEAQNAAAAASTPSTRASGADTRRALNLPEHGSHKTKDELANKSALAVNRQLYRAHRQMRLSVLDASRRFEDNQVSRARDTLMKEQVKEAMGAGLVMRHGTKLQVTSHAIRKYLDEAKAERQVLVDKAMKCGGRRSNRKKTVSDMSSMLNPSLGQDEFAAIAAKALAQTPEATKQVFNASFSEFQVMPDLVAPSSTSGAVSAKAAAFPGTDVSGPPAHHHKKAGTAAMSKKDRPVVPANLPQVDHVDIRKATIPGQFHKTEDPFSSQGMYGGSRLKNSDVKQIQSPRPIP